VQTVTLTLLPDGSPAVLLLHGRDGTPAPYPVRFAAGGVVLLTSPAGAVYCVERVRGLWRCSCPAWKYSDSLSKSCKHLLAGVVLQRWLDAVVPEEDSCPRRT
jgi:hypothetical protein